MMRDLHGYEELFPDEFDSEMNRIPMVWPSSGPIENRGAWTL